MTTSLQDGPGTALRRGAGALPFVAVSLAGAATVGVLAAVSPEEPGHYPTCPFLATTGYWCAGCGALRTVHALTAGDLVTALDRNPLLVLLLPLLGLAWVGWGLRVLGHPLGAWLSPTRVPAPIVWGLFAVIAGYWVARNIPGWIWLSPA